MLKATWIDGQREPQSAPDPRYPNGVEINAAKPDEKSCFTQLSYPAKRRGWYLIECDQCATRTLITTAGRPDDPKSVRIPCKATAQGSQP
jgi:hypothetical protein